MQCGTNCCSTYTIGRHFITKDEKIEMLNDYKEALEKEVKGIDERIESLKKAS